MKCFDWWTKLFWSTSKNLGTYDSTWKIVKGQEDDYTTGCLLDYNYYKMIAIDLHKQQPLDADPKAINLTQICRKQYQ